MLKSVFESHLKPSNFAETECCDTGNHHSSSQVWQVLKITQWLCSVWQHNHAFHTKVLQSLIEFYWQYRTILRFIFLTWHFQSFHPLDRYVCHWIRLLLLVHRKLTLRPPVVRQTFVCLDFISQTTFHNKLFAFYLEFCSSTYRLSMTCPLRGSDAFVIGFKFDYFCRTCRAVIASPIQIVR